jgi:transaldolase
MKIFLDTSSLADLRWAVAVGLVDGVTTRPGTLGHDSGAPDVPAELAEICHQVSGPVFADVAPVTADDLYREGRELARVSDNVVVKVPMIEEGLIAMRRLTRDGIRVQATLVFSAAQALLAARAGAAFVSLSMAELDAVGHSSRELLEDVRAIFDAYTLESEIVATSIRSPGQFLEAARAGADAAAVPTEVLKALLLHPLTDRALDQVLSEWSRRIAKARVGA